MKLILFNTEDIVKNLFKSGSYIYQKDSNHIKIQNKIGRNTKFEFLLKIKIKPSTLGLIVGEGYIGDRQFVFANSNEVAIKQVIEFLAQFNIILDFLLEISTKNVHPGFIEKSKKQWEEIVHQNIKNIRKREEFNNTTNKGTLHIRFYNSCFAKVLKIIIEKSKQIVESDENLSKEYIKGLIAAEGNIDVKKTTGCLYMVRISAKEEAQREQYKRCLEKVKFKIYCKDMETVTKEDGTKRGWKTVHGRGGCVIISRWENFVKIILNNMLVICPDKKQKFLFGFMNNLFTRNFLYFSRYLNSYFTLNDVKKDMNLSRKPTGRILTLIKQGYIKRDESKMPYKHYLTKKYKQLYNKIIKECPIA